jgi:hypothetical protein
MVYWRMLAVEEKTRKGSGLGSVGSPQQPQWNRLDADSSTNPPETALPVREAAACSFCPIWSLVSLRLRRSNDSPVNL